MAIIVVLLGLLASGPVAMAQGTRVALLIANSQYQSVTKLKTPEPDVRLIEKSLKTAGFQSVDVFVNLDRVSMQRALQAFAAKADKAEVALVYYAGHGIEIDHTNYLVPVDAKLEYDRDAEFEAVKLDSVMQLSQGAKRLRIIILDACRNNPFAASMQSAGGGTRSVSRGLARVEPIGDSLIVYSAKAGTTASDGEGAASANSPFATALATRLTQPGKEINLLFRQVRDDVLNMTGKKQEPFTYGSLSSEEFYFIPGAAGATSTRAVAAPVDMEFETWSMCKQGSSRAPCQAYIDSYGKGRFVALARTKLAEFATAPSPAPQIAAQIVAPPPVGAAIVPKSEFVTDLGITVMPNNAGPGILVQAVRADSLAVGQILTGDVIVAINAAAPSASVSPGRQLADRMATDGRVRLLVKRGVATTSVVLRSR